MSTLGLAIYKGRNFLKHIPLNPPIRHKQPPVYIHELKAELKELKSADERITKLRKIIADWIDQCKKDRDELKDRLKIVKARVIRAQRKIEKFQRNTTTNPIGIETIPPPVRRIIETAIKYFNDKNYGKKKKLFINDILARRRTKYPTMVRQVAMYLAKTLTLHSTPNIGRMMGNRDHTTILHSVNKIEWLRSCDPELDADIKAIIGIIEGTNEPTR